MKRQNQLYSWAWGEPATSGAERRGLAAVR